MTDRESVYMLDLRSLSLFRIALGLFLCGQMLLVVLPAFTSIYSPETGLIGNCFADGYVAEYAVPPFIFGISTDLGLLTFIIAIVIASLCFCVGIYPRAMALILTVMLWMFHSRFNALYLGWEMYATVLITIAIFLPTHHHFSIVRRDNKRAADDNNFVSPLGFAALFQIALIYFYNGISKNGDQWLDGSAVQFFLAEFDKALPAAQWLIQNDDLCSFLTWSSLGVELLMPLLIFSPFKNGSFRLIAILFIIGLHWGISVFVDVGNFKYIALCASCLLLPSSFWELFGKRFEGNFNLIRLRSWEVPSSSLGARAVAGGLILIMLISNLSHTAASKTSDPDRIAIVLSKLGVDRSLSRINKSALLNYSFFRQYWHLYSPNPPLEKGYLQLELITLDGDTISTFQGRRMVDDLYANKVQANVFRYLLLKQNRNKKEKILCHCMLMNEIRIWNKKKEVPMMKMEIGVYSYRPLQRDILKVNPPKFSRYPLMWYDVSYSGSSKER